MLNQNQKIPYRPAKELLSCRLCTDIFKKPITLSCGHTFCYYCLYKFMRQQSTHNTTNQKQQEGQNHATKNSNHVQLKVDFNTVKKEESISQNDDIPLPLCPTCSSLIFKYDVQQQRPIKNYKENLTLTNLITHSKYEPALKFDNKIYDEAVQNFDHKILIKIDSPNIQPLPNCHCMIRFSSCFLDDILEQSHNSYVVVEWPNFKQDIGLAGKIQRVEVEYHSSSSRNRENHYRAYFTGLFFVKIIKRKPIEINLKSCYYTQAIFLSEEHQYATLNICKSQPFHSTNILTLSAFNEFLSYYDTLNNHHYLNQIYRLVDPTPLFQRNNPENMIYSCIRILRLKPKERKEMIESFDDQFRIQKINQFLHKMGHLPVEDFVNISIPGKYNSAFVFGVIFLLILLHYFQAS